MVWSIWCKRTVDSHPLFSVTSLLFIWCMRAQINNPSFLTNATDMSCCLSRLVQCCAWVTSLDLTQTQDTRQRSLRVNNKMLEWTHYCYWRPAAIRWTHCVLLRHLVFSYLKPRAWSLIGSLPIRDRDILVWLKIESGAFAKGSEGAAWWCNLCRLWW